jgi:acyl-CoA synthetase (AMP-forming)/AMP-acid ligase II
VGSKDFAAEPVPSLPRIDDYVRHWAMWQPDAEAAVLGTARITYAELSRQVDDMARALIAAGVGRGDRVATLQNPCPEALVAFLATASIGAIWLGLHPRHTLTELSHVLRDAEPKLVLSRERVDGRAIDDELRGLGLRVVLMDCGVGPQPPQLRRFLDEAERVSSADLAAQRANCEPTDPCLLVYTSGSTGAPKGALLHHRGIVHFSREQNLLWPVETLRTLNYFPINHIGSLLDVSTATLVAGGTIVFMEQFEPEASLELMARERITLWGSVPSVLSMQLDVLDRKPHDLSAVQLVVWEGAALPAELLPRLAAVCPRMATNYGMTETSSAITATAATSDADVLLGSVGLPFPGCEVRLAELEGGVGEIQVRSPGLFAGYWQQPQATQAAFAPDGWFRTGDLGRWREDGRLQIVGRSKEMFKSGGYNVYPLEVEQALQSHPTVSLAAVVGVPDPLWQEVGVAYVQCSAAVEVVALAAWCRQRLAHYKLPKRIIVMESLPLLPIGKVDKPSLKARAMSPESA